MPHITPFTRVKQDDGLSETEQIFKLDVIIAVLDLRARQKGL